MKNYTEFAIGNGFKKLLQRYDTNYKAQTSLILVKKGCLLR